MLPSTVLFSPPPSELVSQRIQLRWSFGTALKFACLPSTAAAQPVRRVPAAIGGTRIRNQQWQLIAYYWTSALLVLLTLCCAAPRAHAQTVQRDSQALLLASKSVAAMVGTTSVTDVTISANISYTAGSDNESGTASLEAKGTLESRVSLALSGGSRLEIRNSTGLPTGTATPAAERAGPDGTLHAAAVHNCWTDPAWFFPPLGVLSAVAGDPAISAVYIGLESHNGSSTQHLRFSRVMSNQDHPAAEIIKVLATEDVYLNADTLLPVAIDFNTHPDDDLTIAIPVEAVFSDYRPLGSGQVSYHIQVYQSGTLILDFAVSSIALNSGLSDALFAVTVSPT